MKKNIMNSIALCMLLMIGAVAHVQAEDFAIQNIVLRSTDVPQQFITQLNKINITLLNDNEDIKKLITFIEQYSNNVPRGSALSANQRSSLEQVKTTLESQLSAVIRQRKTTQDIVTQKGIKLSDSASIALKQKNMTPARAQNEIAEELNKIESNVTQNIADIEKYKKELCTAITKNLQDFIDIHADYEEKNKAINKDAHPTKAQEAVLVGIVTYLRSIGFASNNPFTPSAANLCKDQYKEIMNIDNEFLKIKKERASQPRSFVEAIQNISKNLAQHTIMISAWYTENIGNNNDIKNKVISITNSTKVNNILNVSKIQNTGDQLVRSASKMLKSFEESLQKIANNAPTMNSLIAGLKESVSAVTRSLSSAIGALHQSPAPEAPIVPPTMHLPSVPPAHEVPEEEQFPVGLPQPSGPKEPTADDLTNLVKQLNISKDAMVIGIQRINQADEFTLMIPAIEKSINNFQNKNLPEAAYQMLYATKILEGIISKNMVDPIRKSTALSLLSNNKRRFYGANGIMPPSLDAPDRKLLATTHNYNSFVDYFAAMGNAFGIYSANQQKSVPAPAPSGPVVQEGKQIEWITPTATELTKIKQGFAEILEKLRNVGGDPRDVGIDNIPTFYHGNAAIHFMNDLESIGNTKEETIKKITEDKSANRKGLWEGKLNNLQGASNAMKSAIGTKIGELKSKKKEISKPSKGTASGEPAERPARGGGGVASGSVGSSGIVSHEELLKKLEAIGGNITNTITDISNQDIKINLKDFKKLNGRAKSVEDALKNKNYKSAANQIIGVYELALGAIKEKNLTTGDLVQAKNDFEKKNNIANLYSMSYPTNADNYNPQSFVDFFDAILKALQSILKQQKIQQSPVAAPSTRPAPSGVPVASGSSSAGSSAPSLPDDPILRALVTKTDDNTLITLINKADVKDLMKHDNNDNYVFHLAALNKISAPVINALVNKLKESSGVNALGTLINRANKNGETPIMVALTTPGVPDESIMAYIDTGNMGILREIDKDENNVFHLAALNNKSVAVVKKLINKFINADNIYLKTLLQAKNKNGTTPLMIALQQKLPFAVVEPYVWNTPMTQQKQKDYLNATQDSNIKGVINKQILVSSSESGSAGGPPASSAPAATAPKAGGSESSSSNKEDMLLAGDLNYLNEVTKEDGTIQQLIGDYADIPNYHIDQNTSITYSDNDGKQVTKTFKAIKSLLSHYIGRLGYLDSTQIINSYKSESKKKNKTIDKLVQSDITFVTGVINAVKATAKQKAPSGPVPVAPIPSSSASVGSGSSASAPVSLPEALASKSVNDDTLIAQINKTLGGDLVKIKVDQNNIFHLAALNNKSVNVINALVENLKRAYSSEMNTLLKTENKDGKTPVMLALTTPDVSDNQIEEYIDAGLGDTLLGADKNQNNVFHLAALNDKSVNVINALARNLTRSYSKQFNALLKAENKDKQTPLMLALRKFPHVSQDLVLQYITYTAIPASDKDKYINAATDEKWSAKVIDAIRAK